MESYKGTIASKSKKGNSMKGDDGEWYSLFSAEDFVGEWKDTVDFLWEYDKTGKYRNIKKGTMKVTSAGAAGLPSHVPYSNLGVELGHASNVAKDMAIAKFKSTEVGSPEFYKFWMDTTQDVYAMMKGLRARYEEKGAEVATPKPAPDLKVGDEDFDDVFGD